MGIFQREDFSLLGDLDFIVDGLSGEGKDRLVLGAPSSPDGTAATMEEHPIDLPLARESGKPPLGCQKLRMGADDPAVLPTVGISYHDLLAALARLEVELVGMIFVQALHRFWRILEVTDRFKERDDIEVADPAPLLHQQESRRLHQEQDFKDIGSP